MPSLTELDSVNEVPESYSWPTSDDNHPITQDPLPSVDLNDLDATTRIARACERYGAFRLSGGHGVAVELLDKLESELLRLFSLPIEHKLKAAPSNIDEGLLGYATVPIASFFTKKMWSEGFTFAQSPLEHARKLWPDDPKQFSDVLEKYNEEMKKLAMRLIRLMLLSLGLDEVDMKHTGLVNDQTELTGVIRLNSYPACPDPARAMGMAAHTDSSLVTILYQDNTSGLQVLEPGDEPGLARWASVPAAGGRLVVILGDLFQILTNGKFKSGFHRAVVNKSRRRLSAAYFCGPTTARVSPVAKLETHGLGTCYRGVTWTEYRGIKAELFQEALESLKM